MSCFWLLQLHAAQEKTAARAQPLLSEKFINRVCENVPGEFQADSTGRYPHEGRPRLQTGVIFSGADC